MKLSEWGPWIDINGISEDQFDLSLVGENGLGIVTLIIPCGYLLLKDRQIILHNDKNSIYRTVSAEKIVGVGIDYRLPLRQLLDSNSDLLNRSQIDFLKATWKGASSN